MRCLLFAFAALPLLFAAGAGQEFKTDKPADDGSLKDPEVGGKTIKKWIEEIHAKDPSKRAIAMRMVVGFGPELAQQAIPDILKELGKHKPVTAPIDMSVRLDGAIALGTILGSPQNKKAEPKDIAEAVRILKVFCHDEQVLVKARAVQALAALAQRGPDPEIHKALDDIIAIAENRDTWEARQSGLQCLIVLTMQNQERPPEKVLVAFYKGLKDNSMQVRITAAQSLGQYNTKTHFRPGTPEYVRLVLNLENAAKDPEPAVQIWVQMSLMTIKRDPEKPAVKYENLNAVAKHLDHEDASVRLLAAQALGMLGVAAIAACPKVIEHLHDSDLTVVAACIETLAKMYCTAAVPALERLSEDPKVAPQLQLAARRAIEIIRFGKKSPQPTPGGIAPK